ncbi:MAG TPA: pectate lyase [Sphingomicrobium sp.]|nr:pectate lyase [Sphingomicrobium sp.]
MSLGGRGGRIIRVTNLNDSGPGSLRAAIDARDPRIVIFDVGGTIRLKSPLVIRNGRITIAGQTAPGGGITVRDYTFSVHADDVVVRFIRSRLGDVSRVDNDAIWVSNGRRVILDHVSASWGTDESLSVTANGHPNLDIRDVTVQWSIISESLCNSVNPKGRHCYGSIMGASRGARYSLHHNLWADHMERMPRIGETLPAAKDSVGPFFDLRSNVIYNWGGHQAGYSGLPTGPVAYNFIDNSYWMGPDSRDPSIFKEGNPDAHAYFSGNALNGKVLSGLQGVTGFRQPGYALSRPVPMPAVTTDSAARAYDKVLRLAGDSLHRDQVDARVVAGVRSRTGRLIDSQSQVGGWPELARGTPWIDHDGDGMPDDWERAHGLNPDDPRDGNADRDHDGYTNVEEWLNSLAAPAMAH